MTQVKAFENFKKQIIELSDERLTEKQIKDLWQKLPESEKVFFINLETKVDGEVSSEEICIENFYDGLKKIENTLGEVDIKTDEDFIKAVSFLPEHFLGSIKKQECGYKGNVFKNSIKNEILKVKTLEHKLNFKKITEEEAEEEKKFLWTYNMPAFNFNNKSFKNFILYTFYGNKPYKQSKYKTLKNFCRKNNLTESSFLSKIKLTLLQMLLNQDNLITTEDCKVVVEGLMPILDLHDYAYLFENHMSKVLL
ncbi:hypothetical protein EHP00_552 [Ecytonucleospora hepatopenaei]|uniref:Uncharacterized protein n=1 Tax=Ecytonucleospora hepatopenaei TaxID=646526 RepID=A0A1W0E8G0_9MICR|nr:hypothetical protein EHP00_552 [Ecytonucleospora hepatopenaei]